MTQRFGRLKQFSIHEHGKKDDPKVGEWQCLGKSKILHNQRYEIHAIIIFATRPNIPKGYLPGLGWHSNFNPTAFKEILWSKIVARRRRTVPDVSLSNHSPQVGQSQLETKGREEMNGKTQNLSTIHCPLFFALAVLLASMLGTLYWEWMNK